MVLLVTDVFLLLTQVLLWILVAMAARFVLLKALPKAFLGGLVLFLLAAITAVTFFRGVPADGLVGDVWQIISFGLNPFGLILIFLVIAWRDAESKKGLNGTSKLLLRGAVATLLLFSIPLFANFIAQRTEMEAVQTMEANAPALPGGAQRVIVLLGQGTTRLQLRPRTTNPPVPKNTRRDPNALLPQPDLINEGRFGLLANQPLQLTEQGDRIIYTAQLYNSERGNAPLIVVSAGPRMGRSKKEGDKSEDISEAADISRLLQSQFGIPGGAIIQDNDSRSVYDSAANVRKLLETRGINYGNQIMIVTSAIEASRTALTFLREFSTGVQAPTIISRPTDFYTIPPRASLEERVQGRDLIERDFLISDLLPSIDAVSLSSKVVTEYLSSLYYFLRGWIRPLSNR